MIGKLEVIQTKLDTKEKEENPVNKLQKNAANGYAAVVFADIIAS